MESQQIETPMHYLKEADAIGIQHMLDTSTKMSFLGVKPLLQMGKGLRVTAGHDLEI